MYLIILILFFVGVMFRVDQYQVCLYTDVGYSQQSLDIKENIYDIPSIETGIEYRWNKFLSKESINYFSIGLSLGRGIIFPKLRRDQSILNCNSFLELELFAGYGVGFGEFKQHQMSILGVSLLPKFYGLLEEDNFTQIGETEVEWYNEFYTPIFLGILLKIFVNNMEGGLLL